MAAFAAASAAAAAAPDAGLPGALELEKEVMGYWTSSQMAETENERNFATKNLISFFRGLVDIILERNGYPALLEPDYSKEAFHGIPNAKIEKIIGHVMTCAQNKQHPKLRTWPSLWVGLSPLEQLARDWWISKNRIAGCGYGENVAKIITHYTLLQFADMLSRTPPLAISYLLTNKEFEMYTRAHAAAAEELD